MPGSNNFQQWNPSKINQETDAQYAADSERTGGAGTGETFPARTANKVLYQSSTFNKALGDALAAKGYTISDTDVVALAGVLAAVMTQADMAPYAPKDSPAFTGSPTAPTPADNDNSSKVATTAFVVQPNALAPTGYFKLPGGIIIQWITGPWQAADNSEPATTQAWTIAFPTSCVFALVSMQLAGPSGFTDNWYQLISFNTAQVSYQRQRGGYNLDAFQQQTRALVLGIGY
jgi:hypothetical protein